MLMTVAHLTAIAVICYYDNSESRSVFYVVKIFNFTGNFLCP